MHAIKIDYRNYQSVVNVAQKLEVTLDDMATMSQKYVVIVIDPVTNEQKIEIYDETDFRTFFKWVTRGDQGKFMEVERRAPDGEDGEHIKWEPPLDGDLGAV